jgi:hypothetical protein
LTSNILNGRHIETGLVRIMKLIPVVINTKTLTYVKFEVFIFNETKVITRIVTYIQTDRQKTRQFKSILI